MNNLLSKAIVFTAGAAIGSVVTWILVKDKYEKRATAEIDEIREFYFGKKEEEKTEKESEDDSEDDEEDTEEHKFEKPVLFESRYFYERKEGDEMVEPYVISPDEFDEVGYKTESLYLYNDGMLAYVLSGEIVEDIDALVGEDSLNHFGEYEEDSVFVRNENLRTDFEILRADENYPED